ncbi:STAS domain-containing protein [Cryptosporangium japonicum]|uniref:Anti-sigma factor antagonist n=1 Tax=Cryptosporangium japonicum TaxID=80872 RepID=A0ABP3E634_9ACTN
MTDSYFADPDTPLTVTVHRYQTGVRVELSGELDLQTGPLLLGAIDSLLPRPGGPVVLDCTALRFIDARGLATLLRAQATLTDAGYGLAVTNPSGPLRRILSATGLTSSLPDASRSALER